MNDAGTPVPAFIDRLRGGHRPTLARAITAVENETGAAGAVLKAIYPHLGHAHVVGFTGPPGAGKSTLINAYIAELRRRDMTVGVVAVDPSSPITGGAVLGDRIRMGQHSGDRGVFVRSLAARGHLGGLSRTASRVVDLMDASGRDVIIVETVGAGQSEVEIAEVAETKVVVAAPGLGDDIQAIKAGILEIADVFVVNKTDLPLADATARQLTEMLRTRGATDWKVPVLRTIATSGDGVAALADSVLAHRAASGQADTRGPRRRVRRLLATLAAERLHRLIERSTDPRLDTLCEAVLQGSLPFDTAAEEAMRAAAAGI